MVFNIHVRDVIQEVTSLDINLRCNFESPGGGHDARFDSTWPGQPCDCNIARSSAPPRSRADESSTRRRSGKPI